MAICLVTNTEKFLSTPSARRATYGQVWCNKYYYISIHALREEGDLLKKYEEH